MTTKDNEIIALDSWGAPEMVHFLEGTRSAARSSAVRFELFSSSCAAFARFISSELVSPARHEKRSSESQRSPWANSVYVTANASNGAGFSANGSQRRNCANAM